MTLGSIAAYEQYMTQTKAHGMELTPLQPGFSWFMHRLLYRAGMKEDLGRDPDPLETPGHRMEALGYDPRRNWTYEDDAFTRLVRGLHVSFREEAGDNGPYALAFPRWRDSLRQMAEIQLITKKLPAVVYPSFEDGKIIYNQINAPFAKRSFQPRPADFAHLQLTENSSIEDIKAAMRRRGLTHITYDFYHSLDFEDPAALAERLASAGLVHAVHLSLNRTEHDPFARSERAKFTRFARKAFVTSARLARNTTEGEIFQVIANQWLRNPAYRGVQTHVVLEDGPIGRRTKRDHAAIMMHAREIVADPFG